MMAQSRAESTRDTCNYGQYINQFPQNTIKAIQEFERIQKKICRHKMSIMFNEICINEEMLPKYTYIYMYIYIRGSLNKFPDFFCMGTFIDSTHMKLIAMGIYHYYYYKVLGLGWFFIGYVGITLVALVLRWLLFPR